jgi:hypothetical protein
MQPTKRWNRMAIFENKKVAELFLFMLLDEKKPCAGSHYYPEYDRYIIFYN